MKSRSNVLTTDLFQADVLLRENLSLLQLACKDVKESAWLKLILSIVLQLGMHGSQL